MQRTELELERSPAEQISKRKLRCATNGPGSSPNCLTLRPSSLARFRVQQSAYHAARVIFSVVACSKNFDSGCFRPLEGK
jgi:hypothetical protein